MFFLFGSRGWRLLLYLAFCIYLVRKILFLSGKSLASCADTVLRRTLRRLCARVLGLITHDEPLDVCAWGKEKSGNLKNWCLWQPLINSFQFLPCVACYRYIDYTCLPSLIHSETCLTRKLTDALFLSVILSQFKYRYLTLEIHHILSTDLTATQHRQHLVCFMK